MRSVIFASVSSRIRAISAFDHSRTAATSSSAARRRSAASVEERPWIVSTWVLASAWSWLRARALGVLGRGLHRLGEVGHELASACLPGGGGRRAPAAGPRTADAAASPTGRRRPTRRRPRCRVSVGVGGGRGGLGSAVAAAAASSLGQPVGRRPADRSSARRRACRSTGGRSSTEAGIRVGRRSEPCVVCLSRCALAGDPGRVRIVVAGGGCDGVR